MEIVSFPIKNGDVRIFHSFLYVSLPEAKPSVLSWNGPPRRGRLATRYLSGGPDWFSHRRAAVAGTVRFFLNRVAAQDFMGTSPGCMGASGKLTFRNS